MHIKFPKINQVLLILIFSDFIFTTAFGFLAPIFAIFIIQQIAGGTIATVGFSLTVYWIVKSVVQLFVARAIDKNHGEIDDFYVMVVGTMLSAMLSMLFYFADEIWHVYMLQLLMGIAHALIVPPFYGIFTRHVDKGQEAFEWSLYSSFSLGAGAAFGGAVGGIIATIAGTRAVFPIVGILSFLAAILLIFLRPYVLPKVLLQPTGIMGKK